MEHKITIIIVIVVVIISLLIVTISNGYSGFMTDVHIFHNIEECIAIESNKTSNAKIIKYNSPDEDLMSMNLEYSDFYACEYISDDMEFEIFAYVFKDISSAKEYFNNKTGKSQSLETNFSFSRGLNKFRGVVIDGEKAYLVSCKSKYTKRTLDYINSIFTEEIC